MDINTHIASNGIKLVHLPSTRDVAYLAVILNTGSRDEQLNEHGMVHFIEHMIFKGTKKRKAYHVLNRMEDVGGEIDAFTTKEETSIYTAFLKEHYERALELLSDIFFNSTFPEKELNLEREVILDEINSYKDSPAEQIYDDFEDLLFQGHSLGRNILGSSKSLKQISRKKMLDFYQNNYHNAQMVVCSVGNISFNKLLQFFTKYFGSLPCNINYKKRDAFSINKIFQLEKKKNTHQTHCIIGSPAFNNFEDKRIAFSLINNILGGPGMNSRLNMLLREKHGLVYNVESSFNPYHDTGTFSVYFGCDSSHYKKSKTLVMDELSRFCNDLLSENQLKKAKNQFIGQMAISLENPENLLMILGKSFLNYNHITSFEAVRDKIQAIEAKEIRDVASDIFSENRLSSITYY